MLKSVMRMLGVGVNGGPVVGESGATRRDLAASVILLNAAVLGPPDCKPATVMGSVLASFPLPQESVQELIDAANTRAFEGPEFDLLADEIGQHYSRQERVAILDAALGLVYGDEELKKHEAWFLHRLGLFLMLGDEEFRQARERAQGRP